MPYTLSLKKLSVLFLIIVIMQGCSEPGDPGSWKNNKINTGVSSKLHELNTRLFAALKTNNEPELEYIMSKEFIDLPNKNRQVELASNTFKTGNYSLLSEYYIVNRYIRGDTVKDGANSFGNFNLYSPENIKEVYIACFVPENTPNQNMITAIYGKYDYGWKLMQLDENPYKVNGKTAPQLFQAAQVSYSKGYLVNALNNASAAIKCSQPNTIWMYHSNILFGAFYSKILNELSAKYSFPIIIKGISTDVKVFKLFSQSTTQGDFTMIYYLSTIKLKDTVGLKKENSEIAQIINKTIPGINMEGYKVLYAAFNQFPSVLKGSDHFDMQQKLP